MTKLRKAVVTVLPGILLGPPPASYDGVQFGMKLHKLKCATKHCAPWSIGAVHIKAYLGRENAMVFEITDEI